MADPYLMEAEVILQDSTLSPDQVANRIASLCRSVLRDAPARDNAYDTDTPGLEEFLWGLWDAMIALAEEDSSRHDRLSTILAAMKLQGREDWEIWRQPFDWADLPIFGHSVRESFNGASASRRGPTARVTLTVCSRPDAVQRGRPARVRRRPRLPRGAFGRSAHGV